MIMKSMLENEGGKKWNKIPEIQIFYKGPIFWFHKEISKFSTKHGQVCNWPMKKKKRNNSHRKELPCGSAGKESTCNVGHLDSIPGLGRSPGEEKGYPLQYSGLENSKDCIIPRGLKESDTTEHRSILYNISYSITCHILWHNIEIVKASQVKNLPTNARDAKGE